MPIPEDVLETFKPTEYAKVREMVQDGDILLCSGKDPFSKLIRWATKSPWSHVALAFRLPHIDRVIVVECVDKLGVRTVPLSSFIAESSSGRKPYPGKILLARHKALGRGVSQARLKKIYQFALDRSGAPFNNAEVLKIATRVALGRFNRHMPKSLGPEDEYICSEYVARCLKQIDIEVPWDKKGFIAPADFALDPALNPIAQLKTR